MYFGDRASCVATRPMSQRLSVAVQLFIKSGPNDEAL